MTGPYCCEMQGILILTWHIIYRYRPDDNLLICTELSNHLGQTITSVTANMYSCQHRVEI
jgi:hypothetical protein